MDYGQPAITSNESPFFTAGVGDAPENLNPDISDSLNSGNYAPEHDSRGIGNTAISSHESPKFSSEILQDDIESSPESSDDQVFGQVVNLAMPPEMGPTEAGLKTDTKPNFNEVARENDRIAPKTLKLVEKAISDFDREVISPAEFYNFKSDTTEAYMKTFGEQANWKGA